MSAHLTPILGVVEGFYGRPWSHDDRLFLIEHLRPLGLDAYLYAPKADASLRRDWARLWDSGQQRMFRELAEASRAAGVYLAVGFSPFELYRCYDEAARNALQAKLTQILACGITSVGLLFDDMPGDTPDLARRQAEIINDVRLWMGEGDLRVCPTYYSDDPVLDRVFGERPASYLAQLRAETDGDLPFFWTGPEVCSRTITTAHLETAGREIGGPIALWDNYPVNDSKQRSEHLYLGAFERRETGPGVESHWSNAMNQMALSLPALASLARIYGRCAGSADEVLCAAGVTSGVIEACLPLSMRTRDSLDGTDKARLQAVGAPGSRAAEELRAWLEGAYVFDPACLTD